MPYDTTKQSVLFENVSKKAITVKFDHDHASSDGGAVLLKACDQMPRTQKVTSASNAR